MMILNKFASTPPTSILDSQESPTPYEAKLKESIAYFKRASSELTPEQLIEIGDKLNIEGDIADQRLAILHYLPAYKKLSSTDLSKSNPSFLLNIVKTAENSDLLCLANQVIKNALAIPQLSSDNKVWLTKCLIASNEALFEEQTEFSEFHALIHESIELASSLTKQTSSSKETLDWAYLKEAQLKFTYSDEAIRFTEKRSSKTEKFIVDAHTKALTASTNFLKRKSLSTSSKVSALFMMAKSSFMIGNIDKSRKASMKLNAYKHAQDCLWMLRECPDTLTTSQVHELERISEILSESVCARVFLAVLDCKGPKVLEVQSINESNLHYWGEERFKQGLPPLQSEVARVLEEMGLPHQIAGIEEPIQASNAAIHPKFSRRPEEPDPGSLGHHNVVMTTVGKAPLGSVTIGRHPQLWRLMQKLSLFRYVKKNPEFNGLHVPKSDFISVKDLTKNIDKIWSDFATEEGVILKLNEGADGNEILRFKKKKALKKFLKEPLQKNSPQKHVIIQSYEPMMVDGDDVTQRRIVLGVNTRDPETGEWTTQLELVSAYNRCPQEEDKGIVRSGATIKALSPDQLDQAKEEVAGLTPFFQNLNRSYPIKTTEEGYRRVSSLIESGAAHIANIDLDRFIRMNSEESDIYVQLYIELLTARLTNLEGNHEEACNQLLAFIEKYPNNSEQVIAIFEYIDCAERLGRNPLDALGLLAKNKTIPLEFYSNILRLYLPKASLLKACKQLYESPSYKRLNPETPFKDISHGEKTLLLAIHQAAVPDEILSFRYEPFKPTEAMTPEKNVNLLIQEAIDAGYVSAQTEFDDYQAVDTLD